LIRRRDLIVVAAVIAACGCSSNSHSSAEEELAAWLGPDTAAVAGIQLDRLRNGPLSQALPPEWLAALEPFQQATRGWLTYDLTPARGGHDNGLLVIAAGHFPPVPPGAVVVGPGLVLAGSPNAIQAARQRHASGKNGAGELLRTAAELWNEPIWAIIRGDIPLPLHGNSANLVRLLQFTRYTAASATWGSTVELRFTGYCSSKEKEQELEESLRAMLTLGKKAVRTPDLKATLESMRISSQQSNVLVSLTADPLVLRQMLR
jgi:hypothetical protein